jgi:hypothetical protein
MPTNSDYDGFFAGIDGIPLFTYGMIASTIVVLSYMTYMEESLPEEIQPDSSVLNAAITSPVPPADLTEEGLEEQLPMSVPEENLNDNSTGLQENVEEEEQLPPSSPEEGVEEGVEEQPPPPIIGGKNKKRRVTKRRRPQPQA